MAVLYAWILFLAIDYLHSVPSILKAVRMKSPGQPARKPFRKDDLSHLADAVLSSASVGIYIVQQGKFVYISPLYKKLTGYSDQELIGTESLNYIYPDDRESVRQEARRTGQIPRN